MTKYKIPLRKSLQTEGAKTSRLLLGALAGGLLGVGAAFFLRSKSCEGLRKEICDSCHEVGEKICDLKEDLIEQGEDLLESAQQWSKKSKRPCCDLNIVIGGVAGGLLGAAAGFMLTKKSGENWGKTYHTFCDKTHELTETLKDRAEDMQDRYRDRLEGWIKRAQTILSTVNEALEEGELKERSSKESSTIDDVLALANIGIRLFLKKRR